MTVVLRGVRAPGSELVDAVADAGADRDLLRRGDEEVAATGAVVLPGLVDAHVHWSQWAEARRRVDVGAAHSAEEAATIVAAAAPGATGFVVGHGFRAALWDRPPHQDVRERAGPGVPIALVSDDLHAVWLSPAALARLGRTHPTGPPREQEARSATSRTPSSSTPSSSSARRGASSAPSSSPPRTSRASPAPRRGLRAAAPPRRRRRPPHLRPGDPADVVLLGADPLHADVATLREMPVLATVLAGRFTHRTA